MSAIRPSSPERPRSCPEPGHPPLGDPHRRHPPNHGPHGRITPGLELFFRSEMGGNRPLHPFVYGFQPPRDPPGHGCHLHSRDLQGIRIQTEHHLVGHPRFQVDVGLPGLEGEVLDVDPGRTRRQVPDEEAPVGTGGYTTHPYQPHLGAGDGLAAVVAQNLSEDIGTVAPLFPLSRLHGDRIGTGGLEGEHDRHGITRPQNQHFRSWSHVITVAGRDEVGPGIGEHDAEPPQGVGEEVPDQSLEVRVQDGYGRALDRRAGTPLEDQSGYGLCRQR